ncbi:MAG: right-handed parallel beta-helix repeat-containing protein, partial [Desulfobacteraceae bacterium]|nr:right-handed parallel beta-helix repeat-containing protein [Desulfobacteraceae bacterium]
MQSIRIFTLLFLTYLSLTSSLFAATYYVNITGNDSNSGTLTAPWKTISKANSTLQPGDTVYIMPGTYKQAIKPARSGTAGNYITYKSYDENNKATIDGVSDGADIDNRKYIILDGLRITNVTHYWVTGFNNSSYNIIRNCYMRKAEGWGGIYFRYGSNYNKIQHNTLISYCEGTNGEGGPSDTLRIRSSHHTLIEDNYVDSGTHATLDIESDGVGPGYHVIRNNTFVNPMHSNIILKQADKTLIEDNKIYDAGIERKTNWCGRQRDRDMSDYQHKSMQIPSRDLIVRNNIMHNNGSLITGNRSGIESENNRFYNNTLYKEVLAIKSNSNGGPYGNIWKNNIIHGKTYAIDQAKDYSNVIFHYNNIMGGTVKFGGTNSAKNWSGNLALDPQFMDASNRDFRLESTSPMIDAGTFLTKTTNSGSGTVINVEDARYFMDGWGIIEGDLIQLQGQTQPVKILKISGNTITVDKSLTWSSGTGVSLPYNGKSPDIGAKEFSGPKPDLIKLTISCEPTSVNESSSATCTAKATWSYGSPSTVTPTWSVTSNADISSDGVMTPRPGTAGQKVTVSASYTSGGVPKTAPPISVDITKIIPTKTLSGLTFSGPTSINESSSGTYTAKATWSDGTSSTVTPTWSVTSNADISSDGVMTPHPGTAGQKVAVSASYTSGGVPKTASISVSITKSPEPPTAEVPSDAVQTQRGTVTAPMQVVSSPDAPGGSYIETTTSNSGRAAYNFNIVQPGTYKVIANVYAADGGSDSFLVKIDDGAQDIWDVNPKGDPDLFNVWRQDEIAVRGTGTFDAPQFDPLTVELAAGSHTITFNGREPNARLAYSYLMMESPAVPPPSLEPEPEPVPVPEPEPEPVPEPPPAEGPSTSVLLFSAGAGALTTETMETVISPDIPGGSYITPSSKTGASAVYDFNIDQPGTYKIVAEVYSADASADSFKFKIDDDQEDVWDLNPTGDPALYDVWRQDEVTARGTGTFDAPQFDPLKVQLTAGPHTITISGRELDSRLAYFYLIMVPGITDLIEAESGTLTAPMQVGLAAEASGGAYIATSTSDSGSAVYS